MRRKLTSITIPLLFPLFLASHSALADGYLGFGFGAAESSVDELENSTAGRVHGGYMFSENYAIEAGYMDFGEFDAENASRGHSVSTTGVYLALAGFNRITSVAELTGKLGAMQFDNEVSSGPGTRSTDGTSALLGIGVNFYLTPSVALGGELTHVNDVEDEHINSVSVQVHIRLGAGN